jgi:ribosomal protein S18 acetylase RimI-like enzyme
MTIEPVDANDLEEILALQRLAFQSEAQRYNDYTLPPLTQALEGIRDDFERMVFLKASVNGRVVGSVRAYAEGDTCHVGRLVVHPDFQRRGIGRQLMHEIERRFAHVQRFELFTGHASTPALRLYEGLGYTEFKRKALDTHTLVFLEKRNRE